METLGSITIGEAAQLLIGKRYQGVLRRGHTITTAFSDDSLHALRIRCKRLRCLLEFSRPAYGELLKADTTRLKKLQDVLASSRTRAWPAGCFVTTPKAYPCAAATGASSPHWTS